jgi:hypothetical protein
MDLIVESGLTASIATKFAIRATKGGTLGLAIAMLETESLLCNYSFGDGKDAGAANFGIYKMNWDMIKECSTATKIIGTQPASAVWNTVGPTINSDPVLATQLLIEGMEKWSTAVPDPNNPVENNFWAGQRWGSTGLTNAASPAQWADIQNYYLAVEAIKAKCDQDSTVWTSNIRYWVYLPRV